MRALWIANLVLFLLNLWIMGKVGGLIGQVARLEKNVRLSMAGKTLPTADPGAKVIHDRE
jgi:hypothetical protein